MRWSRSTARSLTSLERVLVDVLDHVSRFHAHANAVVDHEPRQALALDEDYAPIDARGVVPRTRDEARRRHEHAAA